MKKNNVISIKSPCANVFFADFISLISLYMILKTETEYETDTM